MPQIIFKQGKISFSDEGKGRAIFLIHGFLGNKSLWRAHVKELKKSFRVICIDLPGHGASDAFGYLHSMEFMAESVKAVLDALKIRKTVMLGHSLGGYVALAFAEKYPDCLLGLILMNSTAQGDSASKKKSRNQLLELLKKDQFKALNLLVPNFFTFKTRTRHWKIKQYLKAANECSLKGIAATIEGMKIRKEREILLRFSPFPFLYFIGLYDGVLATKQQEKEVSLSEKGNSVLFESSSHMIYLEEPFKSIKMIQRFAKKLAI